MPSRRRAWSRTARHSPVSGRRFRPAPLVRVRRPANGHPGPRMTAVRIVTRGFVLNLKMLGTSSFFLLTSVVQPIIFATVAFYMYRSGDRAGTLLYAALGAGMMGVWSTTLFGSGGMIQWQRWQGTLELGVGAPPSMALVYLPFSLPTPF